VIGQRRASSNDRPRLAVVVGASALFGAGLGEEQEQEDAVPLYLTEEQVEGLVTMADAMAAVEECFRHQGEGRATNEPRRRVRVPGGLLHVMFAADAPAGVLGLKSYTTFRGGARFHVMLYSAEDGSLLALMEANRLGQLRTGAASGVATRYLARDDASVAAVFGSGYQARTQVEALGHARSLQEVRVYSRDPERRKAFADELCARLGLWVLPAESPEAALDGADIVTTVTSSAQPVFNGELVRPGMHLNAAGSNSLLKREIDDAAVAKADLVAVDSLAAVPLEGGDLLSPLQKAILYPEALVELGRIVAGKHTGRTAPEQVTLFKSHGIALEDIALAARVYQKAKERGVGTPM
jgi:ornithine cyclodeaminase/alanine dehydrogenase-like protein (mu-crystallin family)